MIVRLSTQPSPAKPSQSVATSRSFRLFRLSPEARLPVPTPGYLADLAGAESSMHALARWFGAALESQKLFGSELAKEPAHRGERVDPITVSVIQHRLEGIVQEMGEAMLRTSYSQILN